MSKQLCLRYLILLPFLIGTPLTMYPTLIGDFTFSEKVGVYPFLTGYLIQLVGAFAGLMDLKRIKASAAEQVLWTMFFISFSMVAFPVYLYKRFRSNALTRHQRYGRFEQQIGQN